MAAYDSLLFPARLGRTRFNREPGTKLNQNVMKTVMKTETGYNLTISCTNEIEKQALIQAASSFSHAKVKETKNDNITIQLSNLHEVYYLGRLSMLHESLVKLERS